MAKSYNLESLLVYKSFLYILKIINILLTCGKCLLCNKMYSRKNKYYKDNVR